jgi:inner membrane protein
LDPLCHTLVGAALAQTGLKLRTPLAAATLVIGANAPDIDAVTYFTGDSLLWRRGWTHGILALAVWPFVLTAAMIGWHRLVRARQRPRVPAPEPGVLLWIAALAVLTHPTLDALNNYGMRWLMPFDGRWFYGDALYIVDPLIWATLAIGAVGSWWLWRRARRPRAWALPARAAVSAVAVYAALMLVLGQAGRGIISEQLEARGVALVREPMVSPVLASLKRRYVVVDDGRNYRVSGFTWWPGPRLERGARLIPKNDAHPAAALARQARVARGFVRWSRFPFFTIVDEGADYLVTMDDARYAPPGGDSFAAVHLRIPKEVARRDSP